MTSVLYFLVVYISWKFSLCSSVLPPSLVSPLDHSLGMETGRHHLHALPLSHPKLPVFLRKDLVYVSGALDFKAAALRAHSRGVVFTDSTILKQTTK